MLSGLARSGCPSTGRRGPVGSRAQRCPSTAPPRVLASSATSKHLLGRSGNRHVRCFAQPGCRRVRSILPTPVADPTASRPPEPGRHLCHETGRRPAPLVDHSTIDCMMQARSARWINKTCLAVLEQRFSISHWCVVLSSQSRSASEGRPAPESPRRIVPIPGATRMLRVLGLHRDERKTRLAWTGFMAQPLLACLLTACGNSLRQAICSK